jgi:hypothetical protein
MVGLALESRRQMQYFLPSAGEMTRPRSLAQHAGDLPIMVGARHSGLFHHGAEALPATERRVLLSTV